MINKACCSSPRSRISRSFSIYELMTLSISLGDSCVLLKCFSLALNHKESGNLFLGRLLWVSPPYISCVGRNFRLNKILKIAVMDISNYRYLIATCFGPLHDSVLLPTDVYLSRVWSKFFTRDSWMERRSTRLGIWCLNISLVSFFVSLGLPVWIWCMLAS